MPSEKHIREVILAPKKGEVVPSPISGREDMENRIQLSARSGLISEVRESIADCLKTEREAGKPNSYLRVLMIQGPETIIVFIARDLHAELQRIVPQIFTDKNKGLTADINLLQLNKWLQQKALRLLHKQGLISDRSKIDLA